MIGAFNKIGNFLRFFHLNRNTLTVLVVAICCFTAGRSEHVTSPGIACSPFSLPNNCVILEHIDADQQQPIEFNPLPPQPDRVRAFGLTVESNVPEIPQIIFTTFKGLEKLILPNANVSSLSPATFEHAINLRELSLDKNRIRTLLPHVFAQAANLKWISLSGNDIDNVENGALDGLENLTSINLNDNAIRVLRQNALTGAKLLFTLRLEHNGLEVIEDGALNLPALGELLLSKNNLKSLADNWLVQAPQVSIVELGYNQLTHVGQAFAGCHHLSILMLDNNPLEQLNLSDFTALEKLGGLSLNDTTFTLPADDHIQHAWNASTTKSPLARLNLSYNNLTSGEVFKHLVAFNQLNVLVLDNNELTHLHNANQIKQHFPQLNIISLVSNPICDWLQDSIDVLRRDNIVVHYSCETIF